MLKAMRARARTIVELLGGRTERPTSLSNFSSLPFRSRRSHCPASQPPWRPSQPPWRPSSRPWRSTPERPCRRHLRTRAAPRRRRPIAAQKTVTAEAQPWWTSRRHEFVRRKQKRRMADTHNRIRRKPVAPPESVAFPCIQHSWPPRWRGARQPCPSEPPRPFGLRVQLRQPQ